MRRRPILGWKRETTLAVDKVLKAARMAPRFAPFGVGAAFGLGLAAAAATGFMVWTLIKQSTWDEFRERSEADRRAADGESERMGR